MPKFEVGDQFLIFDDVKCTKILDKFQIVIITKTHYVVLFEGIANSVYYTFDSIDDNDFIKLDVNYMKMKKLKGMLNDA